MISSLGFVAAWNSGDTEDLAVLHEWFETARHQVPLERAALELDGRWYPVKVFSRTEALASVWVIPTEQHPTGRFFNVPLCDLVEGPEAVALHVAWKMGARDV